MMVVPCRHDVAGPQSFAVFDFGGKRPVVRLAKCRLPSAFECRGDCCFRIESQSAGLGKSALMRLGGSACLAIAAPFREVESGVGLGGEDDGCSLLCDVSGLQSFSIRVFGG